jgi:hypothetical protein
MEQGGDVGETQPEPAPLVRASRDGGTGVGAAIDGHGRREGNEHGTSDRQWSSRACAAYWQNGQARAPRLRVVLLKMAVWAGAAVTKKGRRERCTRGGWCTPKSPCTRDAGVEQPHGDKYSGSEGAGDEDGGVKGCTWRWCRASASPCAQAGRRVRR